MEEKTYVEGFHYPDKVKKMVYNKLGSTDMRISVVSLGGASFGNCYGTVTEEESVTVLHEALKHGLNYIDTAPWYGERRSEQVLGKALADIPRNSYYLGTKVGLYGREVANVTDYSGQKVYEGFNKSLQLLGVDYVDLIQVHELDYAAKNLDLVINETLPTLKKIVDEGRARYIGVTGYDLDTIKDVLARSQVKISSVQNYCRCSLLDSRLVEYIPYFQQAGVGVINSSVTCMGLLTSLGCPSWHPASDVIKDAARRASEIAKSRGVELADLAVQHTMALQQSTSGVVATSTLGWISAQQLLHNVDTALQPATPLCISLRQEIEQQIFSKLPRRDWTDTHQESFEKVCKMQITSYDKYDNEK